MPSSAIHADQIAWLAARQSDTARLSWTSDDVALLRAMVGQETPQGMAHCLGRRTNTVVCKLQTMGYSIKSDVMAPLGLSAIGLARQVGVPYDIVWRAIRGKRLPAERVGRKRYLVRWPDALAFERRMSKLRLRRERVLARIQEPTITKQGFMRLIGLSETHATRYLQHGIVRAWKAPCKYTEIGRERWEWRVSLADANRVKKLRQSGRLRLGKKSWRAMNQRMAREIKRLHGAGRLGLRATSSVRQFKPVVPGAYTVAQICRMTGLPDHAIYHDIRDGRLRARRVRIGRNERIVVSPQSFQVWRKRYASSNGRR